MKFNKIIVNNFMSYYGEHQLNLKDYIGATIIIGNNKDSSAAISNGAGKSSILPNAICFCLFGKDRNLKANEFINEEALNEKNPNCFVKVEFEDDFNNKFEAIRYREHKQYKNNLILTSNDIDLTKEAAVKSTETLLEEILGLDYLTFTSSIYLPQDFIAFSDRKDTERKLILTQILKLDIFDKALIVVKDKLNIVNEKETKFRNEINTLERLLDNLKQTDYKKSSESFEINKKEEIKKLKKKINLIEDKIKNNRETNEEQIIEEKNKLKVITNELNKIDKRSLAKNELTNQLNKINSEKSLIKGKLQPLLKDIKDLEVDYKDRRDLGVGECPICFQVITNELLEKNLSHLKILIEKKRGEENKLIEEYEKLEKKQKNIENELEKFEDLKTEEQKLKSNEKKIIIKLNELQVDSRGKELLKEIAGYERELEQEKNRKNPYIEQIKKQELKIKDFEEEIKRNINELNKIDNIIKYLDFWKEGFSNRGIKSLLMDSILDNFANKTSNYIEMLSSGTINIEFSTQKELKTGGTSENFDIIITNEDGIRRKYENYSGGQKQKIRLAVSWALSDLIMERFDKHYNIEIIDECDHSLDELGRAKIIEVMKKRNKQIFLISQHSDMQSKFDNIIQVNYENGRSSIEVN